MTVGRRLLLSLAALVACTALLGTSALVGLQGLARHYRQAEEQYEQLRSLYEVGFRASTVRLAISGNGVDPSTAQQHLRLAAAEAEKLARKPHPSQIDTMQAAIDQSIKSLTATSEAPESPLRVNLNRCLAQVVSLAAATQESIIQNRRDAENSFRLVVLAIGIFGLVTLAIAVAVGATLYRSITYPLRALDRGITQMASIHLGAPVQERGDREFRRLVRHFNRMNGAINTLHASMRQQVEVKSRQLLRSEQLAGVGYLAAGLAHEINNPLGIIAGYAQTSLRKLDQARTPAEREDAAVKARAALQIVAEEAFRCRDIAVQLVHMACPADDQPESVAIGSLARRAAELVRQLPIAQGRRIDVLDDPDRDATTCWGSASHMLQVMINLLTNALEACPAQRGSVQISTSRAGPLVVLTVTDDGCGMTVEALAHAFDPFYTDKPKRGLTGCGLGLSVSHAIVERHGGRLYAHSDGPGLGSTFSVELPAAAHHEPSLRAEPDLAGVR